MDKINWRTDFVEALPSDPIVDNYTRQVTKGLYSFVQPVFFPKAKNIHLSPHTMELLGLYTENLTWTLGVVPDNVKPFAMNYGGHQFGHWAGQLGDGRAINFGSIEQGLERYMIQLKGAGPTPYSRRGDGFAVLRSSIREHLCSEAMYHLNIPTTRSLSLSLTGNHVLRDVMYDGNAAMEQGAMVCRVSPSFIRFGSFQILAAQQDIPTMRKLFNFVLKRHYPQIKETGKDAVLVWFEMLAKRTAYLVSEWMRVGFVHGVMNTDNMSIIGETIDYGPYGWIEPFDPTWTPNTTDRNERRYRFENQKIIAQWNLIQLANAIIPLLYGETNHLKSILEAFPTIYNGYYYEMMAKKIGLELNMNTDRDLIDSLVEQLTKTAPDMTLFFRHLSDIKTSDTTEKALLQVNDAFYKKINNLQNEGWIDWFGRYLNRLQVETNSNALRKSKMDLVNPKYIFRNYMAQLTIESAEKGDYSMIEAMFSLLKKPYDEQPEHAQWFVKRPEWAANKIGCSMLSCSS